MCRYFRLDQSGGLTDQRTDIAILRVTDARRKQVFRDSFFVAHLLKQRKWKKDTGTLTIILKHEESTLWYLELLLCHNPQVQLASPAAMWSLGLLRPGMLFSGPLCFVVHVDCQCSQFADKSCHFLPLSPPPPSPAGFWHSPTVFHPPKPPIKTNLASREIKPTLAEEWHQLQLSLCAFCISRSTPPLSFPLILSATHSKPATLLQLFLSQWPPPAPRCRWMCSCNRRGGGGASTMWLLCTLDILNGWVHDPHLQIQ